MIILDTNVVSEPLRSSAEPAVSRWLDAQHPDTLYLTALTVAELRAGVAALPDGRRRELLSHRIETDVLAFFDGRILPFDEQAAAAWASLQGEARSRGRGLPVLDSLIAAVARAHGFALATRNVKDFVGTGVELLNPWEH